MVQHNICSTGDNWKQTGVKRDNMEMVIDTGTFSEFTKEQQVFITNLA